MFYVIIAICCALGGGCRRPLLQGAFLESISFARISAPKKTVEGLVGGFVLDVLAMLLFGFIFRRRISIRFP